MKTAIFLFSLFLSAQLCAEEVEVQPSDTVYSAQEIYLLQQLSDRHAELIEKQKELDAKEKELNEKENLLNKHLAKFQKEDSKINQKSKYYMQLPASKAVNLLNELPEQEVTDILSDMPKNIASRLLGKMSEERIKNILQNIESSGI